MQVYNVDQARARPGCRDTTRTPDPIALDPRLAAFAEVLAATDRRDWKAGQQAIRRLRAMGISVCLVTPQGGGAA
jgi:hypothetical protein